jgi:hypothetical protein
MRYHVAQKLLPGNRLIWYYQKRSITLLATEQILVRILIGKIADLDRMADVVKSVPIKAGDRSWNCVTWAKEVIEALHVDGGALGTCVTDWNTIRDAAMKYVTEKLAKNRFTGEAWRSGQQRPPTYDLLRRKEVFR